MLNKRFDRYYVVFFLFNALIYIASSMFSPYISIYYQSIGFSVFQIGLLSAVGPIASILIQPLWGFFSDRLGSRNMILRITLLGTAVSVLLFSLTKQFYLLIAITFCFMSFFTATIPLSDAITINYVNRSNCKFSTIRMGGTLGYAISVIFAGIIIGGNPQSSFALTSFFSIVMLFMSFLMPKEHSVRKKGEGNVWKILMKKEILFILFYLLILYTSLGYCTSFFSLLMKENDYSTTQIGIAMSICALSEIPFLVFAERIINRFSSKTILLSAGLLLGLRMILLLTATSFTGILVSQMLQGVTFMPAYYCGVKFISSELPEEFRSVGQSTLYVIQVGFAAVFSNIAGGALGNLVGLKATYLLYALLIILVTLICIAYFAIRSAKTRKTV